MVEKVGTTGPDILIGADGELNNIYGDGKDPLGGNNDGADDIITGGKNATNNLYGDFNSFSGGTSTGGTTPL